MMKNYSEKNGIIYIWGEGGIQALAPTRGARPLGYIRSSLIPYTYNWNEESFVSTNTWKLDFEKNIFLFICSIIYIGTYI